MITAEEARALATESQAFLDSYLAKIEVLVREAAVQNKRLVPLYIDDLWNASISRPALTVLQKRIMDVLSKPPYNFKVEFCPHGESYVPRGSSDKTEYMNFVIILAF